MPVIAAANVHRPVRRVHGAAKVHIGMKKGARAKTHVIAVRHGHRIAWKSPTHGIARKKLGTIKLSPDARFGLVARTSSAPPITVEETGGNCQVEYGR